MSRTWLVSVLAGGLVTGLAQMALASAWNEDSVKVLMVSDRIEDWEAVRTTGVPFRWATVDWMLW